MSVRGNDIHSSHRPNGNGGYGAVSSTTTPVAPLGAEQQGIGGMLRQLGHDVPELVIKELALARAEITESLRETRSGVVSMVVGGAVLLPGVVILLMAAVYGLGNVMAPWLAALLVGAVVLVVGLAMVMAGKKKLEPGAIRPDRAMDQMHKDRMAMKAGMHSGRIQ